MKVLNTAVGWHRCLDVLEQIVNGAVSKWEDNVTNLQEYIKER